MKLYLLAFLVLFVGGANALSTSQELLSSCRILAKANVAENKVSLPQNFKTGQCWGAFSVIQEVIVHIDEKRRPLYDVCAPAESTLTQLIAIFVTYAERNPKRFHEDFFPVAIDSLREAFPCVNQR